MHPAINRVGMAICAVSATALFLAILVKVGDAESTSQICSSSREKSHFRSDYPCWDWKFDEKSSTCMFNLLFAATVCLETVIIIYFTSSFLKCLFPEFALVAQRHLCCRFLSRYFCVALNFISSALSLSFVGFVLIHRNSSKSCYQFADIPNSCIGKDKSCLLFVLVLVGFLLTLLATLFSAWDARLWYFIKKQDEEREKIYQSYVDYNSIQEVNNF